MGSRSASWAAIPKPQTPLQVNRYFDACVEWLISAGTPEASATVDSAPFVKGGHSWRSIGLCANEARLVSHPVCFLCSAPATERLEGNPFCRAYIVLACAGCARACSAV